MILPFSSATPVSIKIVHEVFQSILVQILNHVDIIPLVLSLAFPNLSAVDLCSLSSHPESLCVHAKYFHTHPLSQCSPICISSPCCNHEVSHSSIHIAIIILVYANTVPCHFVPSHGSKLKMRFCFFVIFLNSLAM